MIPPIAERLYFRLLVPWSHLEDRVRAIILKSESTLRKTEQSIGGDSWRSEDESIAALRKRIAGTARLGEVMEMLRERDRFALGIEDLEIANLRRQSAFLGWAAAMRLFPARCRHACKGWLARRKVAATVADIERSAAAIDQHCENP